MKIRTLALALAVMAAPVLGACNDDDDEPSNAVQATDPTNGRTISTLEIGGANRTTLERGRTTQLTATLRYADGTSRDITSEGALWNSSDTSNATVSASGLVTGVDEGSTEITLRYNGLEVKETITIM